MDLNQHIDEKPDKCGGKPCIAGTRVRVWDVYLMHEREGRSPDEIVAAFPHISLADVHAAMAYFWDNKEAIERQMKEADEFVEQLKAATGPGPLAKKLANTSRDSVSS